MRSYRRRIVLTIGALVVLACYTVHMDESQVKTIASQDMSCDETFIHIQTDDSDDKRIARYTVRGCERIREYDCTTDPNGKVACHTRSHDPSDKPGDDRVAETVGAAAVGCACASLFAHKSSDPPASTTEPSNPNSTTPQRSR